MRTTNNRVACSPVNRDFKPELKTSNNFGTMQQVTELVELKVVLEAECGYEPGDSIYVNGASLDRSTWAKTQFILNKVPLILVPETEIFIVKPGENDDSVCTSKQTDPKGV